MRGNGQMVKPDDWIVTPIGTVTCRETTEPRPSGMILIDFGMGLESPMPKGCQARQIWKLKQRFYRLCELADKHRGTCMNLDWMDVAGCIHDTLDHLEALGVDVETELEGSDNHNGTP